MRELTKKEWMKERWWAVLLYLGMTIAVIVSCRVGLNNPTMSWGCMWFCRILPFTMAGVCIWLITSDQHLVGKCLNCDKTLVVVEDTCSCCGTKIPQYK
jgi:cytochrome bd-type quinol oxidase subunit 2